MAIGSFYYEILGVKTGSSLKAVKKAYHRLVRANHPDLFPDDLKDIQELKMIQINEAYTRIAKDGHLSERMNPHKQDVKTESEEVSPAEYRTVGFHHDVEYAYYKQGFVNYSRALSGIKKIDTTVEPRNDLYYLKRFSVSLAYLRRADMYFSRLVEDYPSSMWARDARIKIGKSEYFNRLYRKILQNIERRLHEHSELYQGHGVSSSQKL